MLCAIKKVLFFDLCSLTKCGYFFILKIKTGNDKQKGMIFMKNKKLCIFCSSILFSSLLTTAPMAAPLPAEHLYPLSSPSFMLNGQDYDTDTLWTQFLEAEANEALLRLDIEKLKKTTLPIGPKERESLYFYLASNQNAGQYSAILQQQYEAELQKTQLEQQKELYKLQKEQAKKTLELLGEIYSPKMLEYSIYQNTDFNTLNYAALMEKQINLKFSLQNYDMQLKNLEYEYLMGQTDKNSFLQEFISLKRSHIDTDNQLKQIEAQLKWFRL